MAEGTKRQRKRCMAAAAVVTTTLCISGLSYKLRQLHVDSTTTVDLTTQERWKIFQTALALKQQTQSIDWETLRIQYEDSSRTNRHRNLQSDGIPIPVYEYNRGKCPNDGSLGVPCSPPDLPTDCSKDRGRFSRCLAACAPSYCCIHDTPEQTNAFAPSCRRDENCAQYAPCYIAWWKLQDIVGPATEFQLDQSDDFFNVDMLQDVITDPLFFEQLLFHHFGDIGPILELLGTADSLQDVFAMPEVWDANSGISGNLPPGTR